MRVHLLSDISNSLIIQWGRSSSISKRETSTINLPITFGSIYAGTLATYIASSNSDALTTQSTAILTSITNNKITIASQSTDNEGAPCYGHYIVIGK